MDALRLLTRSIKTQKKTTASGGQATPSAGPAANPQLFHGDSQANRKRKRGSDVPKPASRDAPSLDFFGGSSGQQGKSSKTATTTTTVDSAVEEMEEDDRNDANGGTIQSEEAVALSQDAQKEILGQHKVKVTLLTSAQADDQVDENSEKKKKKKGKDGKATKDAKPRVQQLYPTPVTDFRMLRSKYSLSRTLAQNIQDQGYTTTTEVQLAALPLMLASPQSLLASSSSASNEHDPISIDLLTVAPTGSGKTLAFMIPLIQALLRDRHQKKNPEDASVTAPSSRAVVLAPTKELATQIANEGRKLALNTGIRVTNIRKGMRLAQSAGDDAADPAEQEAQVPLVKADILVSTPFALLNALADAEKHTHTLADVRYLVLDEADVLLDPLFRQQTLSVWNAFSNAALRASFWSATMGSNIEELVKATMLARAKTLSESAATAVVEAPLVRLVVGLKDSAVPNIDHRLIYAATEQGKLMALRQLLHPAPSGIDDQPVLRAPFLVFTQTIERAVALHSELQYDIPPEAGGISRISVLHSDLSETARDHVMTRFRKGEVWILITTDLLSRGVDFRGVNGVVNYDVPTSAAAYVHRVGRTGRAGREGGVALTYYTDDDVASIKTVANLIAASQKQRGSTVGSQSVQQWLLDALPTPSKRDKQQLKKRGIESRRSATTKDKDTKGGATKTRISTKSGYIRKMENNRRGAIAASQNQGPDSDSGSEHGFGGFDD